MFNELKISAIIPAHNEEEAISLVVSGLLALKDASNRQIIDEIIVCDNSSNDQTAKHAKAAGATVIFEEYRGYGAACKAALNHITSTDIVVFIDGDHAFRAPQILSLLQPIANADLVIGSRVLGTMDKDATTSIQRVGNALISRLLRLIWQYPVTDLGPFRAIRYSALQQLHMQDNCYGWTVEMQIKAMTKKMRILEVPVNTYRRLGYSKISGTLHGTIGATFGIIKMVTLLWWTY